MLTIKQLTNKLKEIEEQINKLKKSMDKLEKIWELEYLIKSKIEKEIYENPENKIHINATDITNTETILNIITKE